MVTSAETLPETNSKEFEVFKLTENMAYTSSIEPNSKELEVIKLSENIAYTLLLSTRKIQMMDMKPYLCDIICSKAYFMLSTYIPNSD